jgi:protoheme IX farnesyltransferase
VGVRELGPPAPSDLLALTKPRITALVLVTTAAGYLAASSSGLDPWGLGWTLLATALLAGGTNALNQLLERDADARMERTRDRPLPAGRVAPAEVTAFAILLVAGGGMLLFAAVNPLTGVLGLATVVAYAFVYTPLKRVSSVALLVGAVPGALPILGGWTAARGGLGAGGWALFAILFFWQIPHFLALGWRYRDQYLSAGYEVIPAGDTSGWRMGLRSLAYAAVLLPLGMAPAVLGLAGEVYLWGALAVGTGYAAAALRFALKRTEARAKTLFLASLIYLPLVLLLLVLDGPLVEISGGAWLSSGLAALALLGPGAAEAHPLATLNASLNAATAVALAAGFSFVRRGRLRAHRGAMLTATLTSAAFLASYVVYHLEVGSVSYGGEGAVRAVYYAVLVSHVILAAAVVPLVLVTLFRALRGRRRAHRRLARWTLPIWAYVSVTGLVVYGMLYL